MCRTARGGLAEPESCCVSCLECRLRHVLSPIDCHRNLRQSLARSSDSGEWQMADSTTYGTNGDDVLSGGNGKDTIYGGDGNDVISGGNGIDTLFGDGGNDQLTGDNSADHLTGGAGDDLLD